MVCIENFTKWVELNVSPSKSSKDSARGFPEGVLRRYKVPGEVLPDHGRDFMRELQHVLAQHGIAHALASREHPSLTG